MQKGLSSFQLKMLAILFMTVDHIGAILFPQVRILRIIGRLSLPIFIFLLLEGINHTHNKRKYFFRLLLFAMISEPIYDLVFYHTFLYHQNQNILFLLALGVIFITLLEKIKNLTQKINAPDSYLFLGISHILFLLLFGGLASILRLDYSFYGITMLYFMYLFQKNLLFYLFTNWLFVLLLTQDPQMQVWHNLSLVFLYLYNGEKGSSLKYTFYLYYPLHLIILYLITLYF